MTAPSESPFALVAKPATDPVALKARLAIARDANRKAAATQVLRVLNLGAGVQSSVIYIMDAMVHRLGRREEVERRLGGECPFPPLDAAIFADTQEKPASVYAHLGRLKGDGRDPDPGGDRRADRR